MYNLEDCDVVAETMNAVKVETDEHPEGLWIPYSQIDKVTHATTKRSSVVRMTAWIARQKGLI